MIEDRRLDVYYHGDLVGHLAMTPNRMVAFQYAGDWLKNGFSISPLSLPLGNSVYVPPERVQIY